jgi:hypothetical protein
MNRLAAELRRLSFSPDANADGQARAMVLELARPASWQELSRVWQGVQADLELPAPAIAVSGIDSYQLWFSLAQPVPAAQLRGLLESLRRRYLADVKPERVSIHPPGTAPPVEAGPERWSAFLTPDLAALFADEPWLDLPPSAEAQADLLSRLQSAKPEAWQLALERLRPAAAEQAHGASPPAAGGADPRRFLLAVMNDPALEMHLRIEAAKALLPYFEGPVPE